MTTTATRKPEAIIREHEGAVTEFKIGRSFPIRWHLGRPGRWTGVVRDFVRDERGDWQPKYDVVAAEGTA